MIVNIPTSKNLNELALRLHFKAWSDLVLMETDFDQTFEAEGGQDWSAERAQYLAYCQPELQSVCTVIQQSNELALKSRICVVSPYLLLLNSDARLSTTPKEIDFATLRTLDAIDLPAAVNSLCDKKLSDSFIQTYNQIRSFRNQISHLGETKRLFSPRELLHLLVAQYQELWSERGWLKDRVDFAAQTRTAFFHDGSYVSANMVAMEEMPFTFSVLTGSEFKSLFGRSKKVRRYMCHDCIYLATTKYFSPEGDDYKTAFLESSGDSLYCIMCGESRPVSRVGCKADGCKGDVISVGGGHSGCCHSCGKNQEG